MKPSSALLLAAVTTAAVFAISLTGTDWFLPLAFVLLATLAVTLNAYAFRHRAWRAARRERRGRYL